MNSPAIARAPGCSRLVLIVAGVLALLGSFAVTAPAQAGYYGDGYYGPRPCADRCGYYAPRRYYAPRYYGGCSSCGCVRRCYSGARSRYYERRYVEREYIERGYGAPHYRRNYGYPSGGYYRSRPYPWGYGGVRGWRGPYGGGYGYRPAAETYTDGYDEAPRPPAPVWGGAGYEAEPEGDGY
jgi:hypothetical protein